MSAIRYCALATFAATLLMGAATASRAGDIAAFRSIGFSPDGRYYAFEQFGIQDGSGFPYSEIVAVDLVDDKFISGTPVKARIDDENGEIGAVRRQAADKAAAILKQYKLDDDPGIVLAYNGPAEITDAGKLEFNAYALVPSPERTYTLTLETSELPAPEKCYQGDPHAGFRLTLTQSDQSGAPVVVHADERIPASRGCPASYAILAVISKHAPLNPVKVAIIQVNTYGFEGGDGRYLAIPLPDIRS